MTFDTVLCLTKPKEGTHMKRITGLLVALVLLLCMGAAAAQEEPISFDVTDYISSISTLDLAPHKGKVLALVFYTGANQECLDQLPVWKMIHDDFAPEEAEIVLVHAWDGEGQPESDQLKERFQLEGMHIYEDENCILCRTLGITAYPNVLILDMGGSPASGYNGQITYTTIADAFTALGATQLQNSYANPAK